MFGPVLVLVALHAHGTQGQVLYNCPRGAAALGDCDQLAFLIRLAVFIAPGLLCSTALLLGCPIYMVAKYGCNRCGGRDQHPNCCCPATEFPARYTTADLLRPRIALAVAALLLGGAAAYGYVLGVRPADDAFGGVLTALDGTPAVLQGRVDALRGALRVPIFNTTTGLLEVVDLAGRAGTGVFAAAVQAVDDVSAITTDAAGSSRGARPYAWIVMASVLGLPFLVAAAGLAAALGNIRRYLPMAAAWAFVVLGLMAWVLYAATAALSLVAFEARVELGRLSVGQTSAVAAVVGCSDSTFDTFAESVAQLERSQTATACHALTQLCFDAADTPATNIARQRVFRCPSALQCSAATAAELQGLGWEIDPAVAAAPGAVLAGATCNDTAAPCTVERCATHCLAGGQLSAVGGVSFAALGNVRAAVRVAAVTTTLGWQFSSCDGALAVVGVPFMGPIGDLSTASVALRRGFAVSGIGSLVALFACCWGAKRFVALSQAGVDQWPIEAVEK